MVLNVSFVQPESKFVNVAVQVLRAGVVINADQSALENGENAFDPVCSYIVANVFAVTVVDGRMLIARMLDADVSAEFVDDGTIEIEFAYHDGDEAVIKAKRDTSSTACRDRLIELDTDDQDRFTRASTYIYAHGCVGKTSPF